MSTGTTSSSRQLTTLHLSSERTWRGGEQQIAYLIAELKQPGVNVHIAVKEGSEFENYCKRESIQYHALPFRNSLDIGTAKQITRISRKVNADIIHLHSSKSHGIGVLSALLGNKTPLVLSRRVDFVPKGNWMTRFKYNHSSIKKIVCVSNKINSIIRSYITQPEKVVTVHSGIDTTKFQVTTNRTNLLREEYNIPTNTLIIGNTSALEDHKDYFTFINTIDVLASRSIPVQAFIIGRGSRDGVLKDYVAKKGLNDKIHFTGFRKDIIRVLPALDLFLITSNEEGLGTSVLDAFASRVPVVATRAGGIPEMVVHRETGLLAAVEDHVSLANAIEESIKDPTLRNSLIENAANKVKDFSKERTAQQTLRIYEGSLNAS